MPGLRPITLALLLTSTALAAAAQQEQTAEQVVFSADQASVDPDTGELVARGNVVMLHEGYLLEAGEVRYDGETGNAIALGGVRITNPDGAVIRASRVELDGSLRAGVVENAHLVLEDGARIAASRGERYSDGDSAFERVVFSPCPACQDDPDALPIWQLRAVRVTHDRERRRLIYDDAFFEVFGVPVLWTPYFSHPDPVAERSTGLLIPDIRTSEELGFVAEIPVHWAISPSMDATVTPIITTDETPTLAAEFRQHLGFGRYRFKGAFTFDDQPKAALTGEDNDGVRGFVFSDGRFLHGEDWQSTYQIRFATDDTFLRIYNFSSADSLVSNYKLEGFFDRSYARTELMGFQGLKLEDIDGLTGHALPWIDLNYVSKPGLLVGTVSARFNSVQVIRTRGMDSRRASASAQWEAPFYTSLGQKIVLDAFVRGDLYDVRDVNSPDAPVFAVDDGGTTVRGMARVSATVSWPFVSHAGGVEQTIEPIIQLMAIPEGSNSRDIPNEDSRTFELNATNLFSLNRAPGFDIWESGSRATYGLKYSLVADDIRIAALAGQSIRTNEQDDFFRPGTGVSNNLSDLVGAIDISWKDWVDVSYQAQFDRDDLSARRHEVVAALGNDTLKVNLGYLLLERGLPLSGRQDREEIRFDANLRLFDDWHVFGGLVHELKGDAEPIEWESGVLYSDECCLEIGVTVRKRFTEDRDLERGTSVIFRIRLRGLS